MNIVFLAAWILLISWFLYLWRKDILGDWIAAPIIVGLILFILSVLVPVGEETIDITQQIEKSYGTIGNLSYMIYKTKNGTDTVTVYRVLTSGVTLEEIQKQRVKIKNNYSFFCISGPDRFYLE